MFAAAVARLPLVPPTFDASSSVASATSLSPPLILRLGRGRRPLFARTPCSANLAASGSRSVDEEEALYRESPSSPPTKPAVGDDDPRQVRRLADWRAARAYKDSGILFEGKVEAFNNGGLLIRFYSLLGFLPYPLMSPSHSCKDPSRTIQDIAMDLVGSSISLKVTEVSEEQKRLIFSEKEAAWSKYSNQVKVGDVFDAMVGFLEEYGAFVHICFSDGCYHLTGLVHVSEISWDLVQEVRDFLSEGDQVKVKVIQIDREKSRINLSIKQLEDDPLMERLDKVIPQTGQLVSDNHINPSMNVEALPGLKSIFQELLQEDGIIDVRLGRQGLEKRVVSQDLELWLSNASAKDKQFTLLARAGRQVQEVYLTTTLDHDGVKKALQRVLGRVP